METRHITVCPVCDSSEWNKIYHVKDWDIEQCPHCDFAKIDPLPTRQSRPEMYKKDKVIERNTKKKPAIVRFSRVMKRFWNKVLKRDKSRIFRQKIEKYIAPGKKVLDVGCGDGSFLETIKDRYECYGVEISDYLAELANNRGGMKVRAGDFQSMDFEGQKFDAITLISIIEHVDDPEGTLKKCYELLNDGGVLIQKTVNYNCLNRKIVKDKWTGLRPPDHIIYFDPKNLQQLLKKLGFKSMSASAWAFNDNMYCDAVK